jgi:hypothetical protein
LQLGVAGSKLLAYYVGSPLGRVNKYLFSALRSSVPFYLAGIVAWIFPAAFGVVGLVVLLLACSQVCASGGPLSAVMVDCCAKCCDHCAKACEAFPNDQHMKACPEKCRKCETMCKSISK